MFYTIHIFVVLLLCYYFSPELLKT